MFLLCRAKRQALCKKSRAEAQHAVRVLVRLCRRHVGNVITIQRYARGFLVRLRMWRQVTLLASERGMPPSFHGSCAPMMHKSHKSTNDLRQFVLKRSCGRPWRSSVCGVGDPPHQLESTVAVYSDTHVKLFRMPRRYLGRVKWEAKYEEARSSAADSGALLLLL